MTADVFVFPASSAQRRLWFVDQLDPGSSLYNVLETFELRGPLNVASLEQALEAIVERHEILRTTFTDDRGEPEQVIHPHATVELRTVDLCHLPESEREDEAAKLARGEARRPFDLGQGPLLRPVLLRLGDERHVLLVATHHIVFDGWSSGVFWRELPALYDDARLGRPQSLQPLPVQYADFSEWQRDWLQGSASQSSLSYWTRQLAGVEPVQLPSDRFRPPVRSDRGDELEATFPADLLGSLGALSRQEGVTLFMTLLAAVQTLLARHSGQEDIAVGTPVAGRAQATTEGLIGCFINQLVLRTDLSGDPTFRDLLARVRATAVDAFAHADLPFERLVQELHPDRSLGGSPLFGIMVVVQPPVEPALATPGGLSWKPARLATHNGTSKFDLTLELTDGESGLSCRAEYSTDLFEPETVEALLARLQLLMRGIVENPDRAISALPLLTERERRKVLVEWNETAVDWGDDRRLHELVEAQAERTPEAEALVYEGRSLSYEELNRRANRLAHHLVELGVGPDRLVGVLLERSPQLPIALLAIHKAGGAYVPLDAESPPERLAVMAGDADLHVLVGEAALGERLSLRGLPLVLVDRDEEAIARRPAENPAVAVAGENLSYVIFTSGSTGVPKGAMNTYLGFGNRMRWILDAFDVVPADRILHKTPAGFDVSVWEMYWPLLAGASLVIARPGGHRDPEYLARLVQSERVTMLHFVPSMLRAFLDVEGVETCRSLRRVMSGGEALTIELQERFFARLDAELVNQYGPSEAAVDVSVWTCERGSARATVPIGRPIANAQLYVLDRKLQPLPVGAAGELVIGGAPVGRGYLGEPELTAQRFLPDPFTPGGTVYRTGDRARWLADGNLEYLGRLDNQLKIRGVRIEPGEIEAALDAHPAVAESSVVVREDDGNGERLIAWIVPGQADVPGASELRAHLRRTLPESMLPAAFLPLDRLPVTPNGKLDRKDLQNRPLPATRSVGGRVAPAGPLEELVAGVFVEVLELEAVGAGDDFFALGGHSLLATQVVSRLREALATNVLLRWLFESPTVRELAGRLEEEGGDGVRTRAEIWLRLARLSDQEVRSMLAE